MTKYKNLHGLDLSSIIFLYDTFLSFTLSVNLLILTVILYTVIFYQSLYCYSVYCDILPITLLLFCIL
jgi:hypothetical protein